MAVEVTSEVQLEIAHVLFVDTVGYSKLLLDQQRKLLADLNAIVRGTSCFRAAEAAGKLIRLPTGDGMALVFSEDAEAPARCAIEISRTAKQSSGLPLRMGIHSGPVSRVVDVNDQVNVTGSGINTAQRVMNCGDAGHILLSGRAAEDLGQNSHWHPYLRPLGECEVKHGEKIQVVNLCTDDAGNAEVPARIDRARREQMAKAAAAHVAFRGKLLTAGAGLLALIALIAFLYLALLHKPSAASPSVKSIAVLPFENLSDDKDNAYFAEGVQDEILTDLSRVADLKVISRTSVLQYRSGLKRNVRQIANELGVIYILEGTVQRSAGRVKIGAQLIDARTDTHVWATSLDRPLADVFAVQSEVAMNIAGQLQAKLSSAEAAAIKEKPTNDLIAYDRFTRAKNLIESTVFSAREKQSLFEATRLLDEAVARDPSFLRALCQLARVHDKIYILGLDHSPARVALADEVINQAVAINRDAGDVHLAQANHLYCAYLDYDMARRELAIATSLLPNDPTCYELAGFIDRRTGDWEGSAHQLAKALQLDPRNVYLLQQLSVTFEHVRHFPEMAKTLDQAVMIAPDDVATRVARSIVDLEWRADPKPMHAVLAHAIVQDPAVMAEVSETWLYLALCERDWTAAGRALAAADNDACRIENVAFPRGWCDGFLARVRGDPKEARAAFLLARAEGEKIVREQPNFGEGLCALGMIEAALGDGQKAVEHGERAVELVPVSKDALNGPLLVQYLAVIYSWTGHKDQAIEQIKYLATIPSNISYGVLRLHPYWDELRGDPRFEQIVNSLAPK
jgi:TolB-like protein/class 3 adenylate cyclase/Tfp pilus assembly protein PilF